MKAQAKRAANAIDGTIGGVGQLASRRNAMIIKNSLVSTAATLAQAPASHGTTTASAEPAQAKSPQHEEHNVTTPGMASFHFYSLRT